MGPIVEAAHKKNIPVIIDDIGGGGSNYDALVISDCVGGGRMGAEYLDKYLKDNKVEGPVEVAIIRNEPSAVFAYSRGTGFKEGAEKAGMKVVKDLSGQGKAEVAYQVMKDIITANPKVKAVFCTNDPMAASAAQACIDSNRKDIVVIGFNGDEIALKAIEAGTMLATVQQYPYDMGKMTAKLADQALNKVPFEFNDKEKKEIWVPVNIIDKNNLQDGYNALK
jgi:ribose transport system substrate-binding protein